MTWLPATDHPVGRRLCMRTQRCLRPTEIYTYLCVHRLIVWVTLTFDSAFRSALRWAKVRSKSRLKSKSKVISLSERLRPNLRSRYRLILKFKLNFGLSPDFSVQLKVSLSERLSERLSQKLKSPIDQWTGWRLVLCRCCLVSATASTLNLCKVVTFRTCNWRHRSCDHYEALAH